MDYCKHAPQAFRNNFPDFQVLWCPICEREKNANKTVDERLASDNGKGRYIQMEVRGTGDKLGGCQGDCETTEPGLMDMAGLRVRPERPALTGLAAVLKKNKEENARKNCKCSHDSSNSDPCQSKWYSDCPDCQEHCVPF